MLLRCDFPVIEQCDFKTHLLDLATTRIDLVAILQKSLDRALFYAILYARLYRVALEVLSQLCTFENSSNCIIISFDLNSFPE